MIVHLLMVGVVPGVHPPMEVAELVVHLLMVAVVLANSLSLLRRNLYYA
jgi:hypothetical protein